MRPVLSDIQDIIVTSSIAFVTGYAFKIFSLPAPFLLGPPTSYILHPTPYTLHPTSCILPLDSAGIDDGPAHARHPQQA